LRIGALRILQTFDTKPSSGIAIGLVSSAVLIALTGCHTAVTRRVTGEVWVSAVGRGQTLHTTQAIGVAIGLCGIAVRASGALHATLAHWVTRWVSTAAVGVLQTLHADPRRCITVRDGSGTLT